MIELTDLEDGSIKARVSVIVDGNGNGSVVMWVGPAILRDPALSPVGFIHQNDIGVRVTPTSSYITDGKSIVHALPPAQTIELIFRPLVEAA